MNIIRKGLLKILTGVNVEPLRNTNLVTAAEILSWLPVIRNVLKIATHRVNLESIMIIAFLVIVARYGMVVAGYRLVERLGRLKVGRGTFFGGQRRGVHLDYLSAVQVFLRSRDIRRKPSRVDLGYGICT